MCILFTQEIRVYQFKKVRDFLLSNVDFKKMSSTAGGL